MLSVNRKISILTFIVATLGLVVELSAYFLQHIPQSSVINWYKFKMYAAAVDLSFLRLHILEYRNFETGLTSSYFDLAFYATLFIGGVFWLASGYKESRLIRFGFSIIFLRMAVLSFRAVIYILTLRFHDLFSYFFTAELLLWGYLSYWVVKSITRTKVIETIGDTKADYVSAPKKIRWFHLMIDSVFCFLVFTPLLHFPEFGFIRNVEDTFGSRAGLYFLLFIFRLIYYPLMETVFGATPAKFLTETRVVDTQGEKITLKNAFNRTLSRSIPFDAWSFLFGNGWHDQLTNTDVASEKRTGVNGANYFLLFPAFLVLGLGMWYGNSAYSDYKYQQKQKAENERFVRQMDARIAHLSVDDIIEVSDVHNSYRLDLYLKPEKITTDDIAFKLLRIEHSYNKLAPVLIEKLFNERNDTLPLVHLTKSDLTKAVTRDFELVKASRKSTMDLRGKQDVTIVNIENTHGALIKRDHYGSISSASGKERMRWDFISYGWPSTVKEVKYLDGSLRLSTALPMVIGPKTGAANSGFYLETEIFKQGELYKFVLTLEDSTGGNRRYIVEGKDLDAVVERSFE